MAISELIIIFIVGILSGFLNVSAGGGSLITMPVLIFMGLPSAVANGTNRVALMAQNIIAITNFKKHGYFDVKLNLMLALPALLGSLVGSQFAVLISDQVFDTVLALVMVMVLVLTITDPHKKLHISHLELTTRRKIISMIIFFFIGIYGGFIQAGVGLIIIAALSMLTGSSLVKINGMKVFIVAVYMSVSLLVFLFNGKVEWLIGIILALGNGIGGYLGSHFSITKGEKWIKIIMIIAVAVMAAKLFGLFELIGTVLDN